MARIDSCNTATKPTLKLAYLLPTSEISGGASVVFQHANRLLRRGHSVLVGSSGLVSQADWFPNQQVPVVRFNDLPDDLDFLIATSWPTAFDVISKRAKRRCYFVQLNETVFYKPRSPLYRATLLSYQVNMRFMTMSTYVQKWLKTSFGQDAVVIPNAIDLDVFHPVEPLEPKKGRPRILVEGAFALPHKGMREAFEAIKGLDVEVWCVSSFGKPKGDFVYDRFFEKVSMEKMRDIYSSCDILLKMSKEESFGLPPLEMMACGGLCVVSKIAGHEEYIRDGYNALMVAPEDLQGARSAVRRLLDDRELQERLRKNGFHTAAERNWESSVNTLETYFCGIIADDVRADAVNDSVNQALTTSYHKILRSSMLGGDVQTIAHIIRRKIKNQRLLRLGERLYTALRAAKRPSSI
jgi:glycosyltransferase involved in cell wall biosynthesis